MNQQYENLKPKDMTRSKYQTLTELDCILHRAVQLTDRNFTIILPSDDEGNLLLDESIDHYKEEIIKTINQIKTKEENLMVDSYPHNWLSQEEPRDYRKDITQIDDGLIGIQITKENAKDISKIWEALKSVPAPKKGEVWKHRGEMS